MSLEQTFKLIELLADGHFHSGAELGEKLSISRSAIWKLIKSIEDKNIQVESVHGKGYRIPQGINLFDKDKVVQYLDDKHHRYSEKINILLTVDSTNKYIFDKINQGALPGMVCLAEQQTAGRGRRGRSWESPFARNIYLSLLWSFDNGPSALTGLTLVVGVTIINALKEIGADGLKLKWPNDVYWRDKKLAGVLTEISIDSVGVCHAVIGIGINLDMPADQTQNDYPWVDVKTILGSSVDKNKLTSMLLNQLFSILPQFEKLGWQHYKQQWETYDCLVDKQVVVKSLQSGDIVGIAKGVDEQGGLRVLVNGELLYFNAGEVSVRDLTI